MAEAMITDRTFGEERALYALKNTRVERCSFEGEEDGESALKEASSVEAADCRFLLRYPLWHTTGFSVTDSFFADTARAAMWYAENGKVSGCEILGIKMLRECKNVSLADCRVTSPEFGWKCSDIRMTDSTAESEYFFLDSRDLRFENVRLKGKYSFQYTENVTADNCVFDTKDAFWHTKNAVVRNSTLRGEYLGWYSQGLTLINCRIIGTQPLCYCKGLKLIGCTMEQTDLSFEYSDVEAEITGDILSVKNPASGFIRADSIGEIITDDPVMDCRCEIEIR